jgi:hypothetical protein
LSFTKPAEPIGETICRAITYAQAPIKRQRRRPTLKGRFAGLELDRRLHRLVALESSGHLEQIGEHDADDNLATWQITSTGLTQLQGLAGGGV